MQTRKGRLAGAAIIVMSSTILSRISGYLRESLIANKIGYNAIGDAYNAAFLVPNLMYELLLGGALAAALIPILSGYIEKEDEEEGWKVVGTFINITFLAMLVFCALGMIYTPQILPKLDKSFNKKELLTQLLEIKLTRTLFPSVAFLMLAGMCNGILNSYHRFAAAAYGPVIYNIGGVLSLFLFGESTAAGAQKVAYGVALSAVAYFLFQLAASYKNLKNYHFKIYLKNPGYIRMFKLAIPSLLSSAISQVNLIVSSAFTTLAAVGSLTMFNTANRTWQLPLGIFAQSLGVALLPSMSARLAVGDVQEFKGLFSKGLKAVMFLSVPSAVAFIVLREPIVRTLFKFTSFTEENVAATGYVLMFFSVALVAQSAQAIVGRAFFASNDTKTPLFVGVSTIVVNSAFSYLLYYPMGVAGMALANSISSVVYTTVMLYILNKRMNGLELGKVLDFSVKVTIAALIMGAVLYPINMVLPVNIHSKLSQVLSLGLEGVLGTVIYFGFTMLLKLEEAVNAYKLVIDKVSGLAQRLKIKLNEN